jgi:phage regulator Rha-like protein
MFATEELALLKKIALENWKTILLFSCISTLLVAIRLHPSLFPTEYQSQAFIALPNFKYIKAANFPKEAYKGYGTASRLQLENIAALLRSPQTRAKVVKECKLLTAYGLAHIADAHKRNKLLEDYYEDKVRIVLEKRAKIEILVYDTQPLRAAQITGTLISIADSFLEKTAARKTIIDAQALSEAKIKQKIAELEAALNAYYRALNIYPLHKTSEQINKIILQGAFAQPHFHYAYDKMLGYVNQIRLLKKSLASLQNDREFRKAEFLNTKLLEVIAPGVPNFEPARPNRLLLCGLAFIVSAFAAYSFLLLLSYWEIKSENY